MSAEVGATPTQFFAKMESGRVLLVDDDAEFLRMQQRLLVSAGFQVRTAGSAEAALVELGLGRFDALVTDIGLAQMGGLDLLQRVRGDDPALSVVVVMGQASVGRAIEAVNRGACRILVKPVPNAEFEEAVRCAVQASQGARSGLVPHVAPPVRGLEQDERLFQSAVELLWVAYQPIVQYSLRQVVAYEALMRSKEVALSTPMQMLEVAERLGRVVELGEAVRRLAVVPWIENAAAPMLFLNLHAAELEDVERLVASGALHKLASRIVLELTERAAIEAVTDAATQIHRLRAAGFRLAIDDLGAGYSGLSSFVKFEPEIVKIDMSLVRDIDTSPRKQKLVRSIMEACDGVQVVAEGVETHDELETLVGIGCDLFQGYLFAKPGPAFPETHWS